MRLRRPLFAGRCGARQPQPPHPPRACRRRPPTRRPWPAAAGARSASRPRSRPASPCRRDVRPEPAARPSPGADSGRTAGRSASCRVMPLRSSTPTKLRSTPSKPFAQLGDDVRLAGRLRRQGCRGRGAGFPPPRPRRGRISARHTGAYRRPRAWCGARRFCISASARTHLSRNSSRSASSADALLRRGLGRGGILGRGGFVRRRGDRRNLGWVAHIRHDLRWGGPAAQDRRRVR